MTIIGCVRKLFPSITVGLILGFSVCTTGYTEINVYLFDMQTEDSLKANNSALTQEIKRMADTNYLKGLSFLNDGQYDQAIVGFNKAIEVDPMHADAYFSRGYIHGIKDQNDKAISDYDIVLKITPKNIKAYLNRGITYVKKENYTKAISDFNKAIQINPKYAKAYSNRGFAYMNKGLSDQAISDFDMAIELNHEFSDVYYNRGLEYINNGRYDQALEDFSKAIEINPVFADAYDTRGFVYLVKLDDKYRGCADWKRACELGQCNNYSISKKMGTCKIIEATAIKEEMYAVLIFHSK